MNTISMLFVLSLFLNAAEKKDIEIEFNAALIDTSMKDTDAVKYAAKAAHRYELCMGDIPDCYSYFEFIRFLGEDLQKQNAYWLLRSDERVNKALEKLRSK